MQNRSEKYYRDLVLECAGLSEEVEYVEFKLGNKDPERIAKYISGMSNAATLWDKPYAYIIWGVEDETHEIVGTEFEYRKARKGNEELEAWLVRMINPKIDFRFHEIMMEDHNNDPVKVVLLEIPCAETEPTRFESTGYIRIGSNLKPLAGHKEKEAALWRKFDRTPFEKRLAAENLSEEEIVMQLDYPGYYRKLGLPIPANRDKVLRDLQDEKFIFQNDAGSWNISNYGALMIAADLKHFDDLSRRVVRIIQYKGETRLEGISERSFPAGYAIGFEDMIQYIMAIIPQEEFVENGIRKSELAFPENAIRELLANTVVHQALDQRGTNPMVEIFSNRIEFSNPGAPLVDINRIIDTVPLSRNERMAGFMHRCGICEERGSGYDKIVIGFTSVMFDGSALSYEENVRKTREVADLAKKYGAAVECEIGVVGGNEGDGEHRMQYSDPEEAARFSRESCADAMAVAIGNAHGVYQAQPKLRYDILEEIRDRSSLPLVLHGGSGISDAGFQKAIRCGIRKVNIATASFMRTVDQVGNYFDEKGSSGLNYFDMSEAMVQGTYENVKHHIQVFSLGDLGDH